MLAEEERRPKTVPRGFFSGALMLIGELLSREERFAAYGPQAVVDMWTTFVVPQVVGRKEEWLVEMLNLLAM